MLVFFSICIFITFLSQAQCIPGTPRRTERRQRHGPRSIVNSSILSANGTRLPSNLQTKVYVQPKIVSADALTNRGVMGERPIITCTAPTAEFHHSHCQHREDITGSLRTYLVWCQDTHPTASLLGRPFSAAATVVATSLPMARSNMYAEIGICEPDEICVDSLYAQTYLSELLLTANCVNKKYFKGKLTFEEIPDDDDDEDEGKAESSAEAARRTASVIVSKDDDQTPLRVQGMDLSLYDVSESGSSSGLGSENGAPILQERNCTDCFELRTIKAVSEKVDDLELQVTLVGAGSVALTGVLWVALMTG